MDRLNKVVPTAPSGDSTNKPASTQYVTQYVTAAISTALTSANLTASLAAKAGTTQIEFLSGGIKTPLTQDYRILEYVPFNVTLTNFVGKLTSGTMSAVLKIGTATVGGTTVTGGTLGVSSTQASTAPTALQTAAVGSSLILTVLNTASPVDFSFMVQFNRTLATT